MASFNRFLLPLVLLLATPVAAGEIPLPTRSVARILGLEIGAEAATRLLAREAVAGTEKYVQLRKLLEAACGGEASSRALLSLSGAERATLTKDTLNLLGHARAPIGFEARTAELASGPRVMELWQSTFMDSTWAKPVVARLNQFMTEAVELRANFIGEHGKLDQFVGKVEKVWEFETDAYVLLRRDDSTMSLNARQITALTVVSNETRPLKIEFIQPYLIRGADVRVKVTYVKSNGTPDVLEGRLTRSQPTYEHLTTRLWIQPRNHEPVPVLMTQVRAFSVHPL